MQEKRAILLLCFFMCAALGSLEIPHCRHPEGLCRHFSFQIIKSSQFSTVGRPKLTSIRSPMRASEDFSTSIYQMVGSILAHELDIGLLFCFL